MNSRYAFLLLPVFVTSFFAGCDAPQPELASFEPNHLFAYRMEVSESVPTEQFLLDSRDLLTEWFGTPDAPKLPPLFAEGDFKNLVSLETMKPAIGPAPDSKEPGDHGLYRQLCASCHGETGQGRGPVAASQNPYPRDFRKGVFKYKASNRNSKPLKSDIVRTLHEGLNGTQMPRFDKLTKTQIDALVDYVVYLSIRGEFERKLLMMATSDLDPEKSFDPKPEDRERVYDVSYKGSTDAAKKKVFDSQVETATDLLTEVADTWVEAEDTVEEFEAPDDLPVLGLTKPEDIDQEALQASIKKGRELYLSQTAACAKCHGESAKGDGLQVPDYDEWTKDWTVQINIKPDDQDAVRPFLARGGMKPQPLAPRNLVEGKLRGGRDPIAIYRKIVYGIAGSPMPGAAMAASETEAGLQKNDIWHLVNYVLSLKEENSAVAQNVAK